MSTAKAIYVSFFSFLSYFSSSFDFAFDNLEKRQNYLPILRRTYFCSWTEQQFTVKFYFKHKNYFLPFLLSTPLDNPTKQIHTNKPPNLINIVIDKDDKKGVDRSSTVIAKDPEGKEKLSQTQIMFYIINSFDYTFISRSTP